MGRRSCQHLAQVVFLGILDGLNAALKDEFFGIFAALIWTFFAKISLQRRTIALLEGT